MRIMAGFFIMLSLALGIDGSPIFVSKWFLAFTAFVGFNLFQSRLYRILPAGKTAAEDGLQAQQRRLLLPAAADRPLFRIAPYVSFCAVFCTFLALPFADGWVALELNAGAFFVLAVMGLEVFGVILGGYASGSKWSLYGRCARWPKW